MVFFDCVKILYFEQCNVEKDQRIKYKQGARADPERYTDESAYSLICSLTKIICRTRNFTKGKNYFF
jgi:hypothetical protein